MSIIKVPIVLGTYLRSRKKPQDSFLSAMSVPARRALEGQNVTIEIELI